MMNIVGTKKTAYKRGGHHPSTSKSVFFSDLIYHLLRTRDIHKCIKTLENIYGVNNFKISVPMSSKTIYIFQDREWVAKVLKKQTKLPFVNKNFDISHGHKYSINAVNTDEKLWHDLHYGLARIFGSKKIEPLMEKYKYILFESQEFNVNKTIEKYFLNIWSEYCFGAVPIEEFTKLREDLISTLIAVFHGNRLNRLPWIGKWTSQRNYHKHYSRLEAIDQKLQQFLQIAIAKKQGGVFYELYLLLKPQYQNALQIAVDNAFLGILVYDFIYTVLLDALVKIAKNPGTNRFLQVQKSMHDGFLYPFRFRTTEENFDGVKSGDYCIINLQKAGLFFSSGSRYCVGQSLFKDIYQKLLQIYEDYELSLSNPQEEIQYNDSKDIPIMLSQHQVKRNLRQMVRQ